MVIVYVLCNFHINSVYDTNSHTRMDRVGGPKVTGGVRAAIANRETKFLSKVVKPETETKAPMTYPTPQRVLPKLEKRNHGLH